MPLLVQLLRQHFRSAQPAILEVDGLRLRLDTGNLYLDGADPRAASLDGAAAAGNDEALRALAHELAGRATRTVSGSPPAADEAGPFPIAPLAAELATIGVRPRMVIKRLGGRNARLQAAVPAVPIGQVVSESATMLINHLAQPASIRELLDGAHDDSETLADLAVLHVLGLVRRADDADTGAAPEPADDLATRLAERVAERLASDPPTEPPAAQREAIARLWQRLGDLDHYQLLDAPRDGNAAAVTGGFDRIARLVHADNAERIGLERGDAMLAALFERAVAAYRTLIDPDRRIAYNRTLGTAPTAPEISADQRFQEKKSIAEENVQRALHHLEAQDISAAVDLLKEAARLDPDPSTWALLAKAQSRNPNWLRHAEQSWREALALKPHWTEAMTALADVLESMGREGEAIDTYKQVLDLAPGDGAAQAAIGRLGGTVEEPKKRLWGRG